MFDFPKIRFKKVYSDLVLPQCNFPNYTRVVVEYDEYENNSDG